MAEIVAALFGSRRQHLLAFCHDAVGIGLFLGHFALHGGIVAVIVYLAGIVMRYTALESGLHAFGPVAMAVEISFAAIYRIDGVDMVTEMLVPVEFTVVRLAFGGLLAVIIETFGITAFCEVKASTETSNSTLDKIA